jgi:hypothetical protein
MKVPADHINKRIDPSALKFFWQRQAPFGCMNIMDVSRNTRGACAGFTRSIDLLFRKTRPEQ